MSKDGVTVAKEIELADKFENMGARLVREEASRTSDAAGDGTTTATILATISANADTEIGAMIAGAMVGKEGVITVEEAKSLASELEVVEGMQFDRGYVSPYFVTNAEKMLAELEDAYLLIHEKKLSSLQPLLPLLETVVQTGKPLLIIAEDIEGEAISNIMWEDWAGTAAYLLTSGNRRNRPDFRIRPYVSKMRQGLARAAHVI